MDVYLHPSYRHGGARRGAGRKRSDGTPNKSEIGSTSVRSDSAISLELLKAKLKSEVIKEKLLRFEYEQRARKYVSRDVLRQVANEHVSSIRTALSQIPYRFPTGSLTPEVHSMLRSLVDAVLDEGCARILQSVDE